MKEASVAGPGWPSLGQQCGSFLEVRLVIAYGSTRVEVTCYEQAQHFDTANSSSKYYERGLLTKEIAAPLHLHLLYSPILIAARLFSLTECKSGRPPHGQNEFELCLRPSGGI